MEIVEALKTLDTANDNHWTQGGLPRMETVSMLVGNPKLTREEVEAAYPGFTRAGVVAPVVETPEQALQKLAEVPKTEVTQVTSRAQAIAAMSAEDLDKQIAEGQAYMAEEAEQIERAKARLLEIQLAVDELIDAKTILQSKENPGGILVQYLQSRQREYAARAEQMQRVKGINIKDLFPQRSA
jgi:hypothetical protein